jgi:phospholipid transport system substrate-binding protein
MTIYYRLLLTAWALLIGLLSAWSALAGEPTETLKPAIERVVKTLEDPALKGDAKTEQRRQALREITDSVFDWTEMARRALGRHWEGRSDAEREEFVGLFRGVLERTYVGKIETYSGEKVAFAGDSVDGDTATVRTKLRTKKGQEVPVDYRLLKRDGRWMIYDVIVEGVGLVSNYRTQFNEIIRTSSYQELVKRLKSRTS